MVCCRESCAYNDGYEQAVHDLTADVSPTDECCAAETNVFDIPTPEAPVPNRLYSIEIRPLASGFIYAEVFSPMFDRREHAIEDATGVAAQVLGRLVLG